MSHQPQHLPRFRWLKRIGLVSVVLLVALIVLRLWAANVADNRLAETIAKIRASGDPIEPKDYDFTPVTNEENAAYHLKRALTLFPRIDGKYVTDFDEGKEPDVDDATYFVAAAKALAAVKRAGECEKSVWESTYIHLWDNPRPLGELRRLAKLVADAAIRQQRLGHDRVAMETLSDVLTIARANETESSGYIQHLVNISIRMIVTDSLEADLLPNLIFSSDSRQQIQALITELLDAQMLKDGLRRAVIGERLANLDLALRLVDGDSDNYFGESPNPFQSAQRIVFRPLLIHQIWPRLELATSTLEAVKKSNSFPQFKRLDELRPI